MTADGSIIIDTRMDNKAALRGIDAIDRKANGLATTFKKIGSIIAAAFAVHEIINFGKAAIELGSNVAEVQNVVDVAFGNMAYKVEEFADTAIERFGMSELAAKKTASTYMAMASNMGLSKAAAADMALTLTGLTGDVASFYNITQELADIKLKSVFTGETETLKDLGIVMTEDNLAAYALSNGITKSLSSMSQAEKVTLRYNFVLDQLSLASGDFVRTQDSWANQTRILSMQWQEFMSVIGQALIQVLTPAVKVLNNIVSALINMANSLNAALTAFFGGAQNQIEATQTEVSGVSSGIEQSVENQNALTDATKKTNKEQGKTIAAFDEINKLSSGGSSASSGSAGSVPGNEVSLIEMGQSKVETPEGGEKLLAFFEGLKQAIQPTVDAVSRLWSELQKVGEFTGAALIDFYNQFLKPVGSWVMGEGIPRFIDAITKGLSTVNWQVINDALSRLWDALAPFAINVGEGLLWFWENVIVPVTAWQANNILPRFLDLLRIAIEGLNNIIEIVKPAFLWLWDNFLKPVGEWAGEVFIAALDTIIGLFEMLVGVLTGDFDMAMEGASKAVEGLKTLFEKLQEGALAVVTAIENALKAFADWINENVVTPISGFFKGLWDGIRNAASSAWQAIKETFQGAKEWFDNNVVNPIEEGFKSFINNLIGFVEGFANFFIRGINGIIGAINNISISVPDWVPGIGGKTFGFNLPKIEEIQLPRLATGAVIPPNREFLAVLGDQQNGTNIEAPAELIRQIMRSELQNSAYGNREEAVLEVDGQQFGKLIYRYGNKENQRIGVSLVGR